MPDVDLAPIGIDAPVAIFDADRSHRYFLRYDLAEPRPGSRARVRRGLFPTHSPAKLNGTCLFVMLNPSKADEHASDPTVTRCFEYVLGWGFRWLDIVNVFPLVSTDRLALKTAPSVKDHDTIFTNSQAILAAANRADRVVLAWGADGTLNDAGPALGRVLEKLGIQSPYVFGLTKEHQPMHPLYLAADAPLHRLTDYPEWREMLWP